MSITCKFDLNSPYKFYYSGDTVSGNVILQLPTSKYVEEIQLVLHGEAKVSWEVEKEITRRNGSTYTETVEYSGVDVYANTRIVLAGEGTVGPGELTLPFSVKVPEHCHSSLQRDYGSIVYKLSVKLDVWNEFSTLIAVFERVDLNLNPALRIPIQAEENKTFCCSSGKLSYILNIPYGGYVSKQVLQYSLQIHNQSLSDTLGYTIAIREELAYKVNKPHNDERTESHEKYSKRYDDRCLRLSTRIFKGDIVMPFLVPNIEGNGVIKLNYELIVEVHFGGCTIDSEIRIPLHIGTSILRENSTDASPSEPFYPLTENGGPPLYQYFKPPTFDEATSSSAPPEEAPPYESIEENSQRPFIGFRILDEKVPETS